LTSDLVSMFFVSLFTDSFLFIHSTSFAGYGESAERLRCLADVCTP